MENEENNESADKNYHGAELAISEPVHKLVGSNNMKSTYLIKSARVSIDRFVHIGSRK